MKIFWGYPKIFLTIKSLRYIITMDRQIRHDFWILDIIDRTFTLAHAVPTCGAEWLKLKVRSMLTLMFVINVQCKIKKEIYKSIGMNHKYCISVSGQRESNRNKSTPIEIGKSSAWRLLISELRWLISLSAFKSEDRYMDIKYKIRTKLFSKEQDKKGFQNETNGRI